MIQLSGAGKGYGHKLLFENADWLITPESRIGLVGANGTGKSTVMKILAGLETFDYGSLSRAKGISAGYLPQDGLTLSGRTIFAECMSVFDELHAMEEEMESLTHSMAELDPAGAEYAEGADRAGIPSRRLDTTHRRVFGRMADAHRSCEAVAAKAEPAVARRAHESPGLRGAQLARGIPRELSERVRADLT